MDFDIGLKRNGKPVTIITFCAARYIIWNITLSMEFSLNSGMIRFNKIK